jgi:hypothetical protein
LRCCCSSTRLHGAQLPSQIISIGGWGWIAEREKSHWWPIRCTLDRQLALMILVSQQDSSEACCVRWCTKSGPRVGLLHQCLSGQIHTIYMNTTILYARCVQYIHIHIHTYTYPGIHIYILANQSWQWCIHSYMHIQTYTYKIH